MKKIFTKLASSLLSFFYPKSCVSCLNALQQKEEQLCLYCMLHLPETNYHLFNENPLKNIFSGRVRVENVASLLFYKKGNQVQKILHSMKYKGNKYLGEYLGLYYGEKLIQQKDYQNIDVIIPIPLHEKKLKLRGYNQSEWIAKGLGKGMKLPYNSEVLIRTEYTGTQTKKNRFNRWENVREVFALTDKEILKGKHILLCDDVLTTGATTEAAIQKLIEIENVKVSVVTLASAM
jgi:ComF family protein